VAFLAAATNQRYPAHLRNPSALFMDTELLMQLAVGGTLATVTDPLEEMIFNQTAIFRKGGADDEGFRSSTFWFGAADSITVSARTYVLLLLTDVASNAFNWNLPIQADLRETAPHVALTIWAALTISTIKRALFIQRIEGLRLGRIELYDRLLDFVIGIAVAAFLVDELQIDVSMGVQSLLAGSGVGALAFSLASKDLAQQIVGGLVVQAWDAFQVGDDIRLGDGTAGTVAKIGLVETEIVGYDNIAIRIPNSQLSSERVSNMSRIKLSRVFQTIRLQYSDLDKLPDILSDIKLEIKASCPKLILDGSKPFQALLSEYKNDHMEAFVNCHFTIPPGSDEYFNNRQQVLLAIARALKKNDVKIALPAIVYQTKDQTIFLKDLA
jgi:small-conductance mechanosensitive channel